MIGSMTGPGILCITLYSAVIVAVIPGFVNSEEQQDGSAVLVKINPFISKSKRIIQFGGDGRYKRNGPEKSALYLEFPESFFEDPKLKRLYRSLIGERGTRNPENSDKTDVVFQIDPSAFGEEKANGKLKKRDVREGELAAFQLKIAPPIPGMKQMERGLHGFVPRHQTTKAWCMETMPQAEWSPEPLMNPNTQESSTDMVAQTMCYPSKPPKMKLRICGGTTTQDLKSVRLKDPCQCDRNVGADNQLRESATVETTPFDLYTQCKSQEPVITHHVEMLCFTTEKCSPKTTFMPYAIDIFSTTYKPILKPSCPPSCTPNAPFAPFQRFLKRHRKDNRVKNFFLLNNSPQSCPPFCPSKCTTSTPLCTSPPTTKCCYPDTTTQPCPTTCSTTCTENRCPVKRARPDDPLRNVLRLFHRRYPRRLRRDSSSIRRRRRVWVFKPKHGLRKVRFRSGENAPNLK